MNSDSWHALVTVIHHKDRKLIVWRYFLGLANCLSEVNGMDTFYKPFIHWFENCAQMPATLTLHISAVFDFNRSSKKVTNFNKKSIKTKCTLALWPHIHTKWTPRAILPGQINNKRHTKLTVHTSIGPKWVLSRLTMLFRVSIYHIQSYKAVQNWRCSLPRPQYSELNKAQGQPQFKLLKNSALS